MTDHDHTTDPPDDHTPTEPTLVVGSNQGEARRAAARIGLPKNQAIAIDQLTNDHLNQTIGLARVPGDNATQWELLDGATTIDLLG